MALVLEDRLAPGESATHVHVNAAPISEYSSTVLKPGAAGVLVGSLQYTTVLSENQEIEIVLRIPRAPELPDEWRGVRRFSLIRTGCSEPLCCLGDSASADVDSLRAQRKVPVVLANWWGEILTSDSADVALFSAAGASAYDVEVNAARYGVLGPYVCSQIDRSRYATIEVPLGMLDDLQALDGHGM